MICKQGHEFYDALVCPVCAQKSSEWMLLKIMERGACSKERVFCILDHIVINTDYWRYVLRGLGISLSLKVPSLCGSLFTLSEMRSGETRIIRKGVKEQPAGKCASCEAQ